MLALLAATPDGAAGLDPSTVAALALGGLLLAVRVIVRARRAEESDIRESTRIVAAAVGVVTGIRLVVVPLTAGNIGPFHVEDRVFIPVGGLTLAYVFGCDIWRLVLADLRIARR